MNFVPINEFKIAVKRCRKKILYALLQHSTEISENYHECIIHKTDIHLKMYVVLEQLCVLIETMWILFELKIII